MLAKSGKSLAKVILYFLTTKFMGDFLKFFKNIFNQLVFSVLIFHTQQKVFQNINHIECKFAQS